MQDLHACTEAGLWAAVLTLMVSVLMTDPGGSCLVRRCCLGYYASRYLAWKGHTIIFKCYTQHAHVSMALKSTLSTQGSSHAGPL